MGRKDAQWIVGLLALGVCSAALVAQALVTLTSREIAVPLMAKGVALGFSRQGLDDPGDIAKVIADAKRAGRTSIRPAGLPEIPLTEVEGLTPREARIMVFTKVVAPIYDQTGDPSEREKLMQTAGVLALISAPTHAFLATARFWFVAVAIALLALLVFLSRGWGRLVAVGLVGIVTSGPIALVLRILASGLPAPAAIPPTSGEMSAFVFYIMGNLAPDLLAALAPLYGRVATGSAAALGAALVGHLVQKFTGRTTEK